MAQLKLGALLVVIVLIVSGSTVAQTSDTYEISSSDTVNIPDKSVTVNGNSYPVTEIILKETQSPISVTIDAPAESNYDLYLYNHDRQVVAMKAMSGSGSTMIDTEQVEPGSYVLGIYGSDGTIKDVIPVVVAGYEVSIDAPSSVESESSFTVTAELTEQRRSPSPSNVEVVLSQDEEVISTVTATQASSTTYTATLEDLNSGTYTLHVNVRGIEEAQDEKQILGVSQISTVTVSDPTTTAPTDTEESDTQNSDPQNEDSDSDDSANHNEDTDGGNSDPQSDAGDSGDSDDIDENTTARTPTSTSTTSIDTTSETEESTTSSQSTIQQTTQSTSTATSTTDTVLTPSQETTATPATERLLPNRGLQLFIALILLGGLFIRLQN